MAETPEASDFTSIQSRIHAHEKQQRKCHPIHLQNFIGNEHQHSPEGIAFSLHDYLELVDYSGRAILENKRGHIPNQFPPILQRLGIDQTAWLDNIQKFEERFSLAAGTIEKLQAMAQQLKQKWLKGKSAAKQLYQASPG